MRQTTFGKSFSPRRAVGALLIAIGGALVALPAWAQEFTLAMNDSPIQTAMFPVDFAVTRSPAALAMLGTQTPAEDAGFVRMPAGATALDDGQLGRARGRVAVPVMVAATPRMLNVNSVTLWDEMPRTNPTPIPQQLSTGNAQVNTVSYSR